MHPNDVLLDGTRQRVVVYHVVMARRKPATQPTGIIDVVKDIVSPWLGAPPAQNRQITQAQGLARAAAETLDQTFAGGFVKAGVQGNKALVKQAAVNAAALGTGYIAGKAVQKTLPVVTNKLTNIRNQNTSYLFHGSAEENLSTIIPQPAYLKKQNLPNRTYLTSDVREAESFAEIAARSKQNYGGGPENLRGSFYVVAGKTKNVKPIIGSSYENESAMANANTFFTNKNARVVTEIKTLKYPETIENLQSLAQKAIEADRKRKLLGFKQPKRR